MTLFDLLEENLNNSSELTNIFMQIDYSLEYLHNHGFCVYDFNPRKINLVNGKITPQSFQYVINDIGNYQNAKEINILQDCKISLMAYNNKVIDGNINQEYFDFICNNLGQFNKNDSIPEDIYGYYEETFLNNNIDYLNKYLKELELKNGNQNTNVMRKSLSTSYGRAFQDKEDKAAFVNILFLPSIIALSYLVGLIIYIFVLK